MFKYDEFYELLFKNDKFINLLQNFHSSKWENLDLDSRYEVVKSLIDCYCEILKIDNVKFKPEKEKKYSGSYIDLNLSLNVSERDIKEGNQYDIIDTIFHEARHNFQHRAIAKKLTDIESVDDKVVKEWKLNFLRSPRGYSNYISFEDENGHLYNYQPVEADAFKTGLSLTKKAYEIIQRKNGPDANYYRYAHKYKDLIMKYFSKEEEYVEEFKKYRGEVFESFNKNNEKFRLEKKCVSIAKNTIKKDVKDMNEVELHSLFSVYVWSYLEDDLKISLLQEYDSRYNQYKPVKIEKVNNEYFKVNGRINNRNDILNILNDMFSYEFEKKVEGIINKKEECDEKVREELYVNMYVKGRKHINYISERDNPFLYDIQPYALYEARDLKERFVKLKQCEEMVYGVNEGDYENIIDFYNYDKYIPYIEKFYGKSFDKIYNNLIKEMRKKVEMIKTKKM